jgi:hypothetical protein
MANATYNRGLFHLGGYNWDTDAVDIGVILVKTATYVFARTHNVVLDLTPVANEAAGAGYVRKSIAAGVRTVTEDDGASAAYLKITDGSVQWVGINAGINLAVVLFFIGGGGIADDANNDLLGYYDTGTNVPIVTNGGDVTLNFNASGAIKLT